MSIFTKNDPDRDTHYNAKLFSRITITLAMLMILALIAADFDGAYLILACLIPFFGLLGWHCRDFYVQAVSWAIVSIIVLRFILS